MITRSETEQKQRKEPLTYADELRNARRFAPELPEDHYWIQPHHIEAAQEKLDRLNRRGQRYLNIPESEALKIVKTGRIHQHTTEDGRLIVLDAIRVEGTPPTAPGYQFIAKLEHLRNEDGSFTNVLKTVPGFEGEIPAKYRQADPNCEVCNRNIYRKETFLVRNIETGEIIQAGRDDLALYTGFSEAEQLANYTSAYADFKASLNNGDPFAPRDERAYTIPTLDVLAITSLIVRERGFSPTSSFGNSTRDTLIAYLHRKSDLIKELGEPLDSDYEKAQKIIDWLDSLEGDDLASDYIWNLKVAATNPYGADDRHMGLLASAVNAYDREMGLRVERKRQADIDNLSEFVGSVGERRDFDLTITRSSSFEGDYGVTYVYEMVDEDNNSFVWFASNPLHRKVPDEAEMAQNAELVEAGRKIFEERILPAGGTLEGLVAVNAHTIGTRIYNARQTMDIPEADIARTRELVNGTGGAFSREGAVVDLDGTHLERNQLSAFVHDRLFGAGDIPLIEQYLEVGEKIKLRATIKDHKLDTYHGRNRKQTVLTRGKLVE